MQLSECECLIFDGACGTTIQQMDLPMSAWDGLDGCNEYLNLTAPDAIMAMHEAFLDAGAQVVETNTFGASSLVLSEYGLEDRVGEINRRGVAHARRALAGRDGCWVAGSVGPGTKLPSLDHIGVDALAAALREQFTALSEAGVDLFIIETCQDLLQAKTAVVTCFEVMETTGREVPVLLSVTIERTGTMLVGSDIAAAAATFEPFPLFGFGLNCATGPTDMESHIRYLSHHWPGRISCIPNQGLPKVVEGRTVYPLEPAEFAARMRRFVAEFGVSVVGGCCGTTPAHIRALSSALAGVRPAVREGVA